MDDKKLIIETTTEPRDQSWRLTAGVDYEDMAVGNDNEERPDTSEKGISTMPKALIDAAALPFNDVDFAVFELLGDQLEENRLISYILFERTESGADLVSVLDHHHDLLLTLEKHSDNTFVIWSNSLVLEDYAKCIHGSAQQAADEVIEVFTFPKTHWSTA